jgi:hypothetical protein
MLAISVNSKNIRRNRHEADKLPTIRVQGLRPKPVYTDRAVICHDGIEVAEIVYLPDEPLSCGAQVYVRMLDGEIRIDGPALDHEGKERE